MLLQKFLQSAIDAHRGTSFSPEKRGEKIIADYSVELENDIQTIRKEAEKFDQDGTDAAGRYQERYERHFSAWISARGRIVSPMIAGPSKFPSERMRKLNEWEQNKYTYFREWRNRSLNVIIRSFRPKETPITELEKARRDLQVRKANHEMMKRANAIVRKAKGAPAVDDLISAGVPPKLARQISQTGFEGFYLTNNLANIKRLEQRVKMLEKKAENHTQGVQKEKLFDGIKIVDNYEEDRLQIIFDVKPDFKTIEYLKSHGFRWSPSNGAWQRKLTPNAKYAAKLFINHLNLQHEYNSGSKETSSIR